MSFKSVLSDVGHALEKVFVPVEAVAKAVEPFVDIAFPGIAPLFNTVVTAVGQAEADAIAAGQQNGTGAQKLAVVLASIEGDFQAYAKANGYAPPAATEIQTATNAVVAFVNALNATPVAPVVLGEPIPPTP